MKDSMRVQMINAVLSLKMLDETAEWRYYGANIAIHRILHDVVCQLILY